MRRHIGKVWAGTGERFKEPAARLKIGVEGLQKDASSRSSGDGGFRARKPECTWQSGGLGTPVPEELSSINRGGHKYA
jgi:hypothetical protein